MALDPPHFQMAMGFAKVLACEHLTAHLNWVVVGYPLLTAALLQKVLNLFFIGLVHMVIPRVEWAPAWPSSSSVLAEAWYLISADFRSQPSSDNLKRPRIPVCWWSVLLPPVVTNGTGDGFSHSLYHLVSSRRCAPTFLFPGTMSMLVFVPLSKQRGWMGLVYVIDGSD